MIDEDKNGLKQSLEDAVAFIQGDHSRAKVTKVPALDVRALRENQLQMTQEQFARLIGSTIPTVASWERKSEGRCPTGPVQKFLFLLQQKPELVKDLTKLTF
ncbi:MAG: NadS family protein [Cyanobacteria bacterium P01_D01_bin.56]